MQGTHGYLIEAGVTLSDLFLSGSDSVRPGYGLYGRS